MNVNIKSAKIYTTLSKNFKDKILKLHSLMEFMKLD